MRFPALRTCARCCLHWRAAPAYRRCRLPRRPRRLSLETLKDVTRTLSSDAFEGREPGTAGEEKTLAYMVERFAAAGLQPGNHGSWFQDVPLVEITPQQSSAR